MVARNTWAAMQGRKALKITWDDGPNGSYDSAAFKATLEAAGAQARQGRAQRGRLRRGAAAGAAKRLEAEYYIPHLAHATMEPPAATARIADGKCEVWGCVQSPQAARDLVAKRLGMPADNVTVQRHAARRRLRPQVQARLRRRGGRWSPRRWTASRSR